MSRPIDETSYTTFANVNIYALAKALTAVQRKVGLAQPITKGHLMRLALEVFASLYCPPEDAQALDKLTPDFVRFYIEQALPPEGKRVRCPLKMEDLKEEALKLELPPLRLVPKGRPRTREVKPPSRVKAKEEAPAPEFSYKDWLLTEEGQNAQVEDALTWDKEV